MWRVMRLVAAAVRPPAAPRLATRRGALEPPVKTAHPVARQPLLCAWPQAAGIEPRKKHVEEETRRENCPVCGPP